MDDTKVWATMSEDERKRAIKEIRAYADVIGSASLRAAAQELEDGGTWAEESKDAAVNREFTW
jgi:hypothetical protein